MPCPMPPGPVADATPPDRAAELRTLDRLLSEARTGQSGVLVLRGAAGIGKTTLLGHVVRAARGFRIVRVHPPEAEAAAPYSGLQRVLAAFGEDRGRLLPHHSRVLDELNETRPDPFLVGVATVSLLSEAAESRPLLCVVDDAVRLDPASAKVLCFVARRLQATRAVLLLAETATAGPSAFAGLPELVLGGLSREAARRLLDVHLPGRVDEVVLDRVVAETRGNPGAILAVARLGQPAGGFGVPAPQGDDWQVRIPTLSPAVRTVLLIAAADPTGDAALVWRAAARLRVPALARHELAAGGLSTCGTLVVFDDPELRARVYGLATVGERRAVHRALADATDADTDPDRRAWHLAHAVPGTDEHTADELIVQATKARERGGPAAAAAFLSSAVSLTLDPVRRAKRALAAAAEEHDAGHCDQALTLLATAANGPLGVADRAETERLRASVTFLATRRAGSAEALLDAARQLVPVDPALARRTCLDALGAALLSGKPEPGRIADVVRAIPAPARPAALDALLDGLLARSTATFADAAEPLRAALSAVRETNLRGGLLHSAWLAGLAAAELWDEPAWHTVVTRAVEAAKEAGSVPELPQALTGLALFTLHTGDLTTAAALARQAAAISDAAGHPPPDHVEPLIQAWRGTAPPTAHSDGLAAAVRANSPGQHIAALTGQAPATSDKAGHPPPDHVEPLNQAWHGTKPSAARAEGPAAVRANSFGWHSEAAAALTGQATASNEKVGHPPQDHVEPLNQAWRATEPPAARSDGLGGTASALAAAVRANSPDQHTATLTGQTTATSDKAGHPPPDHVKPHNQAQHDTEPPAARPEGLAATAADLAAAVRANSLGRHAEAAAAARRAADAADPVLSGWALAELVEATALSGRADEATKAAARLAERTGVSGTDWAEGVQARARALVSNGAEADANFHEAARRLARTRARGELARTHLLHGEHLRRLGRRAEARAPLREARDLFDELGAAAFAQRARRDLLATGDQPRAATALTPQETRIAVLAREGLTNSEIGGRLNVSPRTVEYHLHKVFAKLKVGARTELPLVLTESAAEGDEA
ncbi:AAA family ATPase [Amycolatopsis sp. NPDC051903]|uniref:AAA family ATPase n=1 Tax=Amycolatopsis sp. NPDC051903 TaxID=3363936 RepID=UPI0037B23411